VKLKLNLSVGVFRLWIALNILVFIYIFPTVGNPIEEIQLIPPMINATEITNILSVELFDI
jgi:hypothetical protein